MKPTADDLQNMKEYAEKSNLLFRNFKYRFLTDDEEADIESELNAIGRLLADNYMFSNGYDLETPEGKTYLQWVERNGKLKENTDEGKC